MGRNAQRRKERKMNNNKGGLKDMVAEPQPPAIQITITMSTSGEINVSGPFGNKVVCYGLLEVARDAVRDFKPQQVVVPTLVLPPNLRGGGQG